MSAARQPKPTRFTAYLRAPRWSASGDEVTQPIDLSFPDQDAHDEYVRLMAGEDAHGVLPDDAFVDQNSERVPKDLFLRMARNGLFPHRRIGRRFVARWADVRAALSAAMPGSTTPARKASQPDPLDPLREQVGLVPKGR